MKSQFRAVSYQSDANVVGIACEACPFELALIVPAEPGGKVTSNDGIDNDCDGLTDDADVLDCQGTCDLGQVGDSCGIGSDCCSGNCKGKPGKKTCK